MAMQRKLKREKVLSAGGLVTPPTPVGPGAGAQMVSASVVGLKNLTITNGFIPRLSLLILVITALHAAGIYLFTSGFLLSRLELDNVSNCTIPSVAGGVEDLRGGCWHAPRFKRVVFVVVDALRFDFTLLDESIPKPVPHYLNKMPVFQTLLRTQPGHAYLARVRADAPTTTLQRLKALTTGSLPTFVDAGSNFAGSVIAEDNLLDQMVARNLSIIFMGDDTWDGLYPTQMKEKHPYPSFDVQDLYTVDNGCVEHIFPALNRDPKNWDFLIAHFLGIDHAGHSFGPSTLPMAAKLNQTNAWLEQIFASLDDDTVALVIGDHGMDPKGDHGGDSESEINAGLFVYSRGRPLVDSSPAATEEMDRLLARLHEFEFDGGEPYVYMDGHRTFPQIDVVPTLALLMGLPIPFGNLGTIIPELFHIREEEGAGGGRDAIHNLLEATRLNGRQMFEYLREYSGRRTSADFSMPVLTAQFGEVEAMYEAFTASTRSGTPLTIVQADRAADIFLKYVVFMRKALVAARKIWARFDMPLILMGCTVLAFAVVCNTVVAFGDWDADLPDELAVIRMPQAVGLVSMIAGAVVGYVTGIVGYAMEVLPFDGDSVMTREHEALFLGTMVGMIAFLSATVMDRLMAAWRKRQARKQSLLAMANVSERGHHLSLLIRPVVPTAVNMVFAVVLIILHAAAPASNSFTIHEESITTFLLQTFGAYSLSASLAARNDAARGSLILYSSLFMILTRVSATSTICREETMQTCYPTFNFIPNSSVASPATLLALVALVPVVVTCLRASLVATESFNATGRFVVGYVLPAGLVVSCVYWCIDTFEGHNLFKGDIADYVRLGKVWWAKLGFMSMSCVGLYVWATEATCIGLRKETSTVPAVPQQPGVAAVPTTPHMRIVLLGVRNAMGSAYLVFVGVVYLILVMFQKPMGGVMLGLQMLQIICLVGMVALWRDEAMVSEVVMDKEKEKEATAMKKAALVAAAIKKSAGDISGRGAGDSKPEEDDRARVMKNGGIGGGTDLGLLMLYGAALILVGHRAFFATGHQATLSSVQYELGFVGLTKVNWYLSPTMIAVNTFGSHLLTVVACPLLALWKRPLSRVTQGRFVREVTFSVLWHLIGMSIAGLMATAFAGHFKRHLMVWKIFAPKFLFADIGQLMVDAVAIVICCGSLWLSWLKYREFLDTMDAKGLL
ncbi:mannose-ethanolamine phosphotransferase gpi13 [Irineochytrium annulatum]|nr:mannose-ethanolamine phosphotransferase gpi13 [Irineochytrium annulatum]